MIQRNEDKNKRSDEPKTKKYFQGVSHKMRLGVSPISGTRDGKV